MFIQVHTLGERLDFYIQRQQSQASWFVITGRDFEVDAHNTGGIQGNGQVSLGPLRVVLK